MEKSTLDALADEYIATLKETLPGLNPNFIVDRFRLGEDSEFVNQMIESMVVLARSSFIAGFQKASELDRGK